MKVCEQVRNRIVVVDPDQNYPLDENVLTGGKTVSRKSLNR